MVTPVPGADADQTAPSNIDSSLDFWRFVGYYGSMQPWERHVH
jgi:hypothetical protein